MELYWNVSRLEPNEKPTGVSLHLSYSPSVSVCVCVDGSWRRGESSVCLCARRYDTRENLIVPHRTRIQKAFAAAAADRRHRAGNFVGCWLQGKIVSRSVPDLLPVVWIQRLMEPIMIRSRLLNVCILNKNAFNVYVASLYSAPRHVEPIHTYVPLKKNNFRSLIFCSRVRCETLKGQAMRRISQSLIRIWWRYDECASGLFTSFSSSFIQFLFFMCGVWQPSGSLTGFPSCFDKGRITSRPCIHPPDTQTWREPERSDCRPSRHRWHLGYSIFTGIFFWPSFLSFFLFLTVDSITLPLMMIEFTLFEQVFAIIWILSPLAALNSIFFFAFPCCVQRMHIIYSSKWMSWKTQVTRYTSVCLIFSVAKVMTGSVFGFGCCRSFFSVLSCLYGSLSSGLLLLLGCHFSTY